MSGYSKWKLKLDELSAYSLRLAEIARRKSAGGLLNHQVDVELAAVRHDFKVKQKAIEADFRRVEERANSSTSKAKLGILSAEDTQLIKPMRDYAERFAIINTGGKAVVMNLTEPDLSRALMARSDFEFMYQGDWIEVAPKHTIYPAKEFVKKPPKNTQIYHGGLVFRPSGTVAANQFNLYKGMLIEPDPSGSCSLLYELIEQVWASGDSDVAESIREWLMHTVAHPGEKIGTCVAIRGEPGDGKSIVFERLMSTILGDMLLRVTNHRMILGDFNEALIGKLVTVLEEAAFSGDKQSFDQMKELITGDKVLINPKFKAPITVDNYSRLVVISNHDHFLHIKPGDRRYTVLKSSPAWQGTEKFEQLVDQWSNGGAARFVHDALNHSFRRFDDRKRLVINAIIKTPASVRQMALSRSGLEKCIVEFLLAGSLKTGDGYPIVFNSDGIRSIPSWGMDDPLDIKSQDLERIVRSWLDSFDRMAARHEASLHTIIGTLHRYIGATEEARPKGRVDDDAGPRIQLPTVRRLPTRRQAIEHAWQSGLITEDEYRAANTDTKMPDDLEFEAYEEKFRILWETLRRASPLSAGEVRSMAVGRLPI